MSGSTPRLLLIGAGHAQLLVLEALAQRRLAAGEVVLVSPRARQLYSGMIPGLVEGRYTIEQLTFDLPALARSAGATFVEDTVVRIEPASRSVTLAGGRMLAYDVAALNIGGSPAGVETPGVRAHALLLKPFDRTALLVPGMEQAARTAGPEPLQVVVVGAGAAGIEIALTARARLDRLGASRAIITLVDSTDTLLRHDGAAASEAAERALRRGEVTLRLSTGVEEVGPAHLRVTGGRVIPADLVIWSAGTEARPLFRDSGLPVDSRGHLLVDDTLAVVGTPGLFGAGDAVALQFASRQATSGASAVRQGHVLVRNLALTLAAQSSAAARYQPQSRTLSLINTGDGRAIFSYSGVVATARWAMMLKDRIDRRFMRRFQRLYA